LILRSQNFDRYSKTSCSGTTSVELGVSWVLTQILREGFTEFGKSMRGYLINEAVYMRQSLGDFSPVRIPRDPNTFEHLQIKGLYPCGEGAGYAGGIISAAIDGEKCALMIAASLQISLNYIRGLIHFFI
jgi:uncharacterized FAD-dependent dehydrogenase